MDILLQIAGLLFLFIGLGGTLLLGYFGYQLGKKHKEINREID